VELYGRASGKQYDIEDARGFLLRSYTITFGSLRGFSDIIIHHFVQKQIEVNEELTKEKKPLQPPSKNNNNNNNINKQRKQKGKEKATATTTTVRLQKSAKQTTIPFNLCGIESMMVGSISIVS